MSKNIKDYKDLYEAFMRLKKIKPQQEYTVVSEHGKGKVKPYGKDSRR